MNALTRVDRVSLAFDVRDLALVREVAAAGGVTRAGSRLHLSQSAISHRLRSLELRLGTPLFLRLGKRMVLTSAGERVLATAQRVLDELGRAEDEVRLLARDGTGVLRLSTQCYTGYHWLPPLLRAFHARHPRVDVQIVVDATHRPVDALLAGEIDLAVLTANADDSRLFVRRLFEDEMVAIVAPSHPFASRAHIELADLAAEHLIVYKTERRDSYVFTRILDPARIHPDRVSQVPLTEAILEMVKAEMGVAVLARWAVEPALQSGALRALRMTHRGVIRQWSAATLRGRSEPRWQADFVKLLRERGPTRRRVALLRARASESP
jgi:LysR family transcriptional regulator for metE and metH